MGSPFLVAGYIESFVASFPEDWASGNARQCFT